MKWIIITITSVAVILVLFFIKISVKKPELDNKKPQEIHESEVKNQNTQTKPAEEDTSTNDPQPKQPEKSLPLPAKKLKKILSEERNFESLDDRINAANKAIAEIDQQLSQAGYLSDNSSTPLGPDEKSKNLNERIQNIQDHLNN